MRLNNRRLRHLAQGPTTVEALEKRLRHMLGHLTARDRQSVLDAIEAIHELATRLHAATAPPAVQVERIADAETRVLSSEASLHG